MCKRIVASSFKADIKKGSSMSNILSYFKGSAIFALVSIIVAATFLGGVQAALIVAILGVLEISLSFDNAVVNAKQLETMDAVWKKRFITWGMVIAVFGMRLVFPLAIVSIVAGVNPLAALHLAVYEPKHYEEILTSAHIAIAGFGGAFLMMVGLSYFFDKDKEVHWIAVLEKHLSHLEASEIAVTLTTVFAIAHFLPAAEAYSFLSAGMMGVALFVMVEWLGEKLEAEDAAVSVAKAGLGAFIYLEVLDASFSFDGVIGAFALSNNIFVIALGLGIGAMFVRSLTLMLVDKGTLSEFKYLEHGAFYAICTLAALMFVGTMHEIPDVVTGLIGAAFIGLALVSSIIANRNDKEAN